MSYKFRKLAQFKLFYIKYACTVLVLKCVLTCEIFSKIHLRQELELAQIYLILTKLVADLTVQYALILYILAKIFTCYMSFKHF